MHPQGDRALQAGWLVSALLASATDLCDEYIEKGEGTSINGAGY